MSALVLFAALVFLVLKGSACGAAMPAGSHTLQPRLSWVPAFAGMSGFEGLASGFFLDPRDTLAGLQHGGHLVQGDATGGQQDQPVVDEVGAFGGQRGPVALGGGEGGLTASSASFLAASVRVGDQPGRPARRPDRRRGAPR